jgi:hypothetical protein
LISRFGVSPEYISNLFHQLIAFFRQDVPLSDENSARGAFQEETALTCNMLLGNLVGITAKIVSSVRQPTYF